MRQEQKNKIIGGVIRFITNNVENVRIRNMIIAELNLLEKTTPCDTIKGKELYLVEWVNSVNSPGTWEFIPDMKKPKDMICVSVGWIEKETEDNIVIIPHISDIKHLKTNGHAFGTMTIPKVAIRKRSKLNYE